MWFRRHWYWPSAYIVVGIIVALLTKTSTSRASQVFSYRYWRYSCGRSYSAQPSAASWAFTSRASLSPDPPAKASISSVSACGAVATSLIVQLIGHIAHHLNIHDRAGADGNIAVLCQAMSVLDR
jgi:hypothetical protein